MRKPIILALLLFLIPAVYVGAAQDTQIFIYDSNGNSATGTIRDGNLYLQDSKGNTAFGTVRDGSVFLQGSNGETVIGTIRDGNVFLTDKEGTTTGTVRDGHIFLNHSDGSTTFGNYDENGNVHTNTVGLPATQQQDRRDRAGDDDEERKRIAVQKQKEFEAGQAVGAAIGNSIRTAIYNRRLKNAINKACFKEHAEGWRLPSGGVVSCADWMRAFPIDAKGHQAKVRIGPVEPAPASENYAREQAERDARLAKEEAAIVEQKASFIAEATNEDKAARVEDSKQAHSVMEAMRQARLEDMEHGLPESSIVKSTWHDWQEIYCLYSNDVKYTDLDGKEQTCKAK
jgi:hypothetical protein